MIFECIQRERLPLTRHEFTEKGTVIGRTEIPKPGCGKLFLGTDCFETQLDGVFKPIKILKNGADYGCVTAKVCVTKKVLFIKTGYEYYELNLSGENYLVYESGLGANQHFYSIYKDDKVIAVIHKPDRVVNYLDKYICYLENRNYFIPTALYCLFLESTAYYNIDATGNVIDGTATITAQKELVEKYDPTFIERIKQREGYTD